MKQPLPLGLLLGFVLMLLALPGLSQTTCAPTAGLVARYALDETQGTAPQDATGHVGAGTLSGGAWQPGGGHDGGGALALAGADRLVIPLNWQPTKFSYSFWLKPTRLFDWGQATGAGAFWGAFGFHSTHEGAIYVGIDVPTRMHLPTPNLVEVGIWQHFVFTFDDGVGTLYKNGQPLATQAGMTMPAPWQGIVALGDALYDELRIYDRAVSLQEARDLYRCGPAACPPVRVNISADVALVGGQATVLQASGAQAPSALDFDGVDDVVQVPGATSLSLQDVANTFTVEAWVKPTAAHEIDDQRSDGTSGQRYLIFPAHGGTAAAGMGISVGTNGVSVYEHAGGYMPAVLVWRGALRHWTHVAVVYQNRQPSLYIRHVATQHSLL